MTEANSEPADESAATDAGADVDDSVDSPLRLAGLFLALLLMVAAGFFATIALGITPYDFAPRFTGTLVSEDPGSVGFIPVVVSEDTEIPPGWWCFSEGQLAEAGGASDELRDDQRLCLVPDVFTGTSTRAEADANARGLNAPPSATPNPGENGVNWAGWLAGICAVLGLFITALTQHEKFPWSTSSKLARAKARRALSRI